MYVKTYIHDKNNDEGFLSEVKYRAKCFMTVISFTPLPASFCVTISIPCVGKQAPPERPEHRPNATRLGAGNRTPAPGWRPLPRPALLFPEVVIRRSGAQELIVRCPLAFCFSSAEI